MNIVRWEPVREMVGLRHAMERLFDDGFFRPLRLREAEADGRYFPLDVYHTPEAVVARAVLPGVRPEDVEISIDGNSLRISASSKEEGEVKDESYLRREWHRGTYARIVSLPEGLRGDQAEAVFEDGVLTLTIPKAEEIKPKIIKVKAKGLVEGKKK
ncbi:MAG: Hsp20/alpha crystallin family protein [Dehalococcoidia bacterium]|jgi:HSP20 family protein|nr:Hsp20/alpha crystallin family protein [Dehalococcoidia bacterium]MDP6511161.1 Hsp20/alpha crystallin family protein [Dehalococcoidia bacterium]